MTNRVCGSMLFALMALSWGCGSSSAPASPPADAGPTATFDEFYSAVVVAYKCTECHVPGKIGVTMGELDMSTQELAYTNLVNQPAKGEVAGSTGVTCASTGLKRVDPGNASDSLIVLKTEGNFKTDPVKPPCGSEMPLGCPANGLSCLGPADVKTMSEWINGGAPAP